MQSEIHLCFGLAVLFTTQSQQNIVSGLVSCEFERIKLILLLWFNMSLAADELATLQEAFAQYEAKTCITFIERTNQPNYVAVQKTGGG